MSSDQEISQAPVGRGRGRGRGGGGIAILPEGLWGELTELGGEKGADIDSMPDPNLGGSNHMGNRGNNDPDFSDAADDFIPTGFGRGMGGRGSGRGRGRGRGPDKVEIAVRMVK